MDLGKTHFNKSYPEMDDKELQSCLRIIEGHRDDECYIKDYIEAHIRAINKELLNRLEHGRNI